MKAKDFPPEVVNQFYEVEGLSQPRNDNDREAYIEEREIEQKPADDITFENLIIIPSHGHDLRESNVFEVYQSNLRRRGYTHLKKGPHATIYEKIDPAKPALLIFSRAGRRGEEFWYYQV